MIAQEAYHFVTELLSSIANFLSKKPILVQRVIYENRGYTYHIPSVSEL